VPHSIAASFCRKPFCSFQLRSIVDRLCHDIRKLPALDVGEQREARFDLGLEAAPVDEFTLEARDEALRHRVVAIICWQNSAGYGAWDWAWRTPSLPIPDSRR